MLQANVAEFKSHLSEYLQLVQEGESLEIRKRNVPLAKLSPLALAKENKTVLGCGRNSAVIHSDLTEPALEASDWHMLEESK